MHSGTAFAAQLQYSIKIASEAQCHFRESKYHIPCHLQRAFFAVQVAEWVENISTTLGYECKVCYSLQRKYKHMQK